MTRTKKSTSQPSGMQHLYERIVSYMAARPRTVLLCNFSILFVLFFVVSLRMIDPDFGWHLQAGNYFRAHGIPSHDVFTYTARQFPWIDHEWGNDVIVSFIYGIGGYSLLAAVYALIWSLALVIAGARARLFVLLLAFFAILPYVGIRPEAWTALLLAITVRLLRTKRKRLVWLLPLLFIPWVNLHAGFVLGLALIAYYGLYDRRPSLFGVLGLSLAATIVNAYGARLYIEVARTLFDSSIHSQITEWQSFVFPYSSLVFIVVWGVGGALFEPRTIRSWIRPSIPMLLAAASATRNVPMFVLVALGECGGYVERIAHTLRASTPEPRAKHFITGSIIVLVLIEGFIMRSFYWPIGANRAANYPQAAVAYLRANGCENGNIFNDYNYGGYLIWQLPTQPVFIDGRMTPWKAPDGQLYLTKYYDILQHPEQYHTTFARYNIRCVLLEHNSLNAQFITLLQRSYWRPVVNNSVYVLLMSPDR